MIGDTHTGKTSIVNRKTFDLFFDNTLSTIGAAFSRITHVFNDTKYHLHLWDTAGQEQFRSLCHLYYRNSHCVLIVFDLTNMKSLQKAREWYDEIEQNKSESEVQRAYILVGTKLDLREQRAFTDDDVFDIF